MRPVRREMTGDPELPGWMSRHPVRSKSIQCQMYSSTTGARPSRRHAARRRNARRESACSGAPTITTGSSGSGSVSTGRHGSNPASSSSPTRADSSTNATSCPFIVA